MGTFFAKKMSKYIEADKQHMKQTQKYIGVQIKGGKNMNDNKKRLSALVAVIGIFAGSAVCAEYIPGKEVDTSSPIMTLSADAPVEGSETINGAILYDVKAENVNGIVMIPLRAVAEGLGYTVTWTAESRSIDLAKGAQFITMSLDKDEYAFSRRAPQSLGAAPTLVGDSTYVPLTFVEEIIGGYYTQNEDGTYKIVTPSIVTVTEIGEDGAITVQDDFLGEVVIFVTEETEIVAGGKKASFEDIKPEMVLGVEYSPAMTMSLPPQTAAVKIIIENAVIEEEQAENVIEGTITEVTEDGLVIVKANDEDKFGTALVISEETVISKGNDRRIYKADDLTVGTKISAKHSEAMTRSLPPQTVALAIEILG